MSFHSQQSKKGLSRRPVSTLSIADEPPRKSSIEGIPRNTVAYSQSISNSFRCGVVIIVVVVVVVLVVVVVIVVVVVVIVVLRTVINYLLGCSN